MVRTGRRRRVAGLEHEEIRALADATIVGQGIKLDKTDELIPLMVKDDWRNSHMWIWGTTRVGKTRLMEDIITQDIAKGNSVVLLDPKSDIGLFSKICQTATLTGRLGDLMLFTPIFPKYSVSLDPLKHFSMPEELVSHITSGVRTGTEPYFESVAYEISTLVVQALLVIAENLNETPNFNLDDIRRWVSKDALEVLFNQVSMIGKSGGENDKVAAKARVLARTMEAKLQSPPDYYAKISSTLSVALNELCEGNMGLILGRARQNNFIERIEQGRGVILVCQLGAMLTKRAAYTAGKVILSSIQAAVGRRFASGGKINPPLCVHIDEAHAVLYPSIGSLFAQAGGAGVFLNCAAQSVNQLYAELGIEEGKSILDNCNTRIYMRVADADTALYVSEHMGEKRVFLNMMGMGTHNMTLRDDIRPNVEPQQVLGLKQREFYLTTYDGLFRGKTRDVANSRLTIVFPEVTRRWEGAEPAKGLDSALIGAKEAEIAEVLQKLADNMMKEAAVGAEPRNRATI